MKKLPLFVFNAAVIAGIYVAFGEAYAAADAGHAWSLRWFGLVVLAGALLALRRIVEEDNR